MRTEYDETAHHHTSCEIVIIPAHAGATAEATRTVAIIKMLNVHLYIQHYKSFYRLFVVANKHNIVLSSIFNPVRGGRLCVVFTTVHLRGVIIA